MVLNEMMASLPIPAASIKKGNQGFSIDVIGFVRRRQTAQVGQRRKKVDMGAQRFDLLSANQSARRPMNEAGNPVASIEDGRFFPSHTGVEAKTRFVIEFFEPATGGGAVVGQKKEDCAL